jgi:hypothetical protein
MAEILLCKDICPLVASCAGRKITRGEDSISFEKDVLKEEALIGYVGVSVRLNPKYAATFTGLTVDENSPACNQLTRKYSFVAEGYSGMKLSGIHKCRHLSPNLSDHCVDSYGQPADAKPSLSG